MAVHPRLQQCLLCLCCSDQWLGPPDGERFKSLCAKVDAEMHGRLAGLYKLANICVMKAFKNNHLHKALGKYFLKHMKDRLPSHPIASPERTVQGDHTSEGLDYDLTGGSDCDYDLMGDSDCNYDMKGDSDSDSELSL